MAEASIILTNLYKTKKLNVQFKKGPNTYNVNLDINLDFRQLPYLYLTEPVVFKVDHKKLAERVLAAAGVRPTKSLIKEIKAAIRATNFNKLVLDPTE